jgi:6-pyruvoyltetrahydropterin/6-carboxytetrahydropterin synthase
MFEVSQRFFFDAAHSLQRDIEAEPSRRIHGHTYDAEVAIRGEPHPATGMVADLGHLRRDIIELRKRLDHTFLDDLQELGKPTLENLCVFIAEALKGAGYNVSRVSVWRERSGDRCDFTTLNRPGGSV